MIERSKLYLRTASAEFSEARAMAAPTLKVDGVLRTRFVIELPEPMLALRFDPDTRTGIYRVLHLRWTRFADRRELLHFDTAALGARIVRVHGVRLPEADATLTLWAVDDDPHFEFSWPQNIDGPAAVELEIDWTFEPIEAAESFALAMSLADDVAEAPASAFEANDVGSSAEVDASLGALELALARHGDRKTALLKELEHAIGRRHASLTRRLGLLLARRERAWREELRGLQTRIAAIAGVQQASPERETRYGEELDKLAAILLANRAAQERVEARLDAIAARLDEPLHRRFGRAVVALGRAIRRGFDGLVDFVRPYRFAAVPQGDVTADEDGTWQVSGPDPRFLLTTRRSSRPSAGWYLLDVETACDDGGVLVDSCLYVDYGAGMTEATRIPLALAVGLRQHRLAIKLLGDARALRFDPTCGSGRLHVGTLRLRKLTRLEAALRLAWPTLTRLRHSPRQLFAAFAQLIAVGRGEGISGIERRLRGLDETQRDARDFGAWAQLYDTLDETDRQRIRAAIDVLPVRPRFSILVPVYNTPEAWLRRCLNSVLSQLYPDWELCIADDASTKPHVAAVLREYAARDARIRVEFRRENGHIAAASNTALAMASGDYIVLLDHDDELAEHALYMVAERLAREPQLRLVYSDEDKIDDRGRRYDPYFKPDWNPELFFGQNVISHLGVYASALVREVGGFRSGFDGSQDYDLALRCIERIPATEIGHIPHVLYHWRAVPGSTALAAAEKDYTDSASLRALREHLARIGVSAKVESTAGGYCRVRYALPAEKPLVSLVVPTRDRVDLLRICVDSLRERTCYPAFEILVVDNQSREPATRTYFAELAADPRVRVLRYDEPFNFSAINNFAVAQARGSVIGLINNDIEVIHVDWLDEMLSHALRPQNGAVGAMLYYPDDRIQHAGVIVGFGGVAGHAYQRELRGHHGQMGRARLVQNVSSVTAACLVIRKSIYEEVGGLDETLTVAFNDIDFCLRVRERGYRNVWTPFAELYHHESASRGYEDSPEKLARFHREIAFMQRRWGDALLNDPAYNPNLALDREPFALARPPRQPYPFRVATAGAS